MPSALTHRRTPLAWAVCLLVAAGCGGGLPRTTGQNGVTISPSSATVPAGNTQVFTASPVGQSVTWSVSPGGAGGTIGAGSGVYNAPANNVGTDTVVATSNNQSSSATVTVTPSVSLGTSSATVQYGRTLTVSANVRGVPNGQVTFSLLNGGLPGSNLTVNGNTATYTAPALASAGTTDTLVATFQGQTASTTINLTTSNTGDVIVPIG